MKQTFLAAALAGCVALTGCVTTGFAQTPQNETDSQKAERQAATRKGALQGAGIGCALGALGSIFSKDKSEALKNCAIGGAVGAVTGGIAARQAQIKSANAIATEANTAGKTEAEVSTRTVTVQEKQTDGSVQSKQTEALDTLHIDLDAALVKARDPKIARILAKAATLASGDTTGEVITIAIFGSVHDRAWMRGEVEKSLSAAKDRSHVRISESDAKAPALEVAPVPDVRR